MSSSISSRRMLSLSSTSATSFPNFSDEAARSSCASVGGSEMNESPILYLYNLYQRKRLGSKTCVAYGIFTSSSASSSSVETSSRSSFSFYKVWTFSSIRELVCALPHLFRLQFSDEIQLSLVKSTKSIDLVLVLTPHFDVFAARCGLFFSRELL